MKFAGYYHSEDAQYCERCGAAIANVFQVKDEHGEIHEYGSTCVNIVLADAAAEAAGKQARRPTLPSRKSYERKRKERNLNAEYLKAVADGETELAEALKAKILA